MTDVKLQHNKGKYKKESKMLKMKNTTSEENFFERFTIRLDTLEKRISDFKIESQKSSELKHKEIYNKNTN